MYYGCPDIKVGMWTDFWLKVRIGDPDECWPWTQSLRGFGYGRWEFERTGQAAHRVAYEFANGAIKPGEWILHKCDNPPCCNPAHLFPGDAKDNMIDALSKGRFGGRQAKVTEKIAREIIGLFDGGMESPELSRRFNISMAHVRKILNGKSWRHLGLKPTRSVRRVYLTKADAAARAALGKEQS